MPRGFGPPPAVPRIRAPRAEYAAGPFGGGPPITLILYRIVPYDIVIDREQMSQVAAGYEDPGVAVLGSHSALEIMDGAKDEGFRTTVYCQEGRQTPYQRFTRVADKVVVFDKFPDMASPEEQRRIIGRPDIVVPHRSLAVYLGYDTLENDFAVPIFGNRRLFRAEERSEEKGQYYMLRRAGLRLPAVLEDPRDIDRPCIVKAQEKERHLERAFFVVSSYDDYKEKSSRAMSRGTIDAEGLARASIEELAIGTYMNFNYFASPLTGMVDFMGVERRLQTNIMDYNALPAAQQAQIDVELQNIEVGHTPASVRESLLEKVITMGDRFARAARRDFAPGVIGPFSLQSVITKDLEMVVYDVSLRVPGNPILATTTPYTKYQYGETFGVGRRIAMELRKAVAEGRLADVVT